MKIPTRDEEPRALVAASVSCSVFVATAEIETHECARLVADPHVPAKQPGASMKASTPQITGMKSDQKFFGSLSV
jgi:hypothetical protein